VFAKISAKDFLIMKFLIVAVIVVSVFPLAVPQQRHAARNYEGFASKSVRRQIAIVENQLKQALAKCDTAALDRLLVDYYAGAFGESERAVGKKRTINTCPQGGAPYYEIVEHKQVTIQGELAVIKGVGKALAAPRLNDIDTAAPEREVRIERTWSNKPGRWILIGQWIRPADEPESR